MATKVPQAIAHRGNRAAHAENTMAAFRSAVSVGAHAIETDVHLSRDGVAVLSHDASLKRCFGVEKAVCECEWAELASLRTVDGESMARLSDLLMLIREEEKVWILLDIKLDDDPQQMLKAIREALSQVPSQWEQRIILGCWNASTVKACHQTLPGFSIAHIGISLSYARHFQSLLPDIGLNMAIHTLVRPILGTRFMRSPRRKGPLYAWTVNSPRWMRWCIERGDVIDGVVTDDPALYLELCEQRGGTSWREWVGGAVDMAARQVLGKLFFWYIGRTGKLDRMDAPKGKED